MTNSASPGDEELPRAWRRAFNRMKGKADDYLRDPQKALRLVEQAQAKAAQRSGRSGPLAGVSASLGTMGRLVRAYVRREYRRVPWGIIVSAAAGLLYFVVPLDAVPDVLLGFGLIDDAAIIAFVATRLGDELARFEAWERERRADRLRAAAGDAVDVPITSGQDAGDDASVIPPAEEPAEESAEEPPAPPEETPGSAPA
jgi:uncharacterized membrane protein YkvA (DUF1232 family)